MAKSNIDSDSIKAFAEEIVRNPSHTLDDISRATIYSYDQGAREKLLDIMLNFTNNDCPAGVKLALAGQVGEIIEDLDF